MKNRIIFLCAVGTAIRLFAQVEVISNGSVGVGTTSPSSKLELNVGANDGLRLNNGTVNGVVFNTSNSSLTVGTVSAHPLNLLTNNAMRVTVASAGNVGVGTTSPSAKLDLVYDSSAVDGLRFQDTASGGRAWKIGSGTGALGRFGFYDETATSMRMVIDASGNVGIGTISPGYFSSLFQVHKGQDSTTRMIVSNDNSGSSAASEYVLNAYGNSWALGMGSLANNSNGFYIGKDVATGVPAAKYFSITTSGNIGIGTTSPTQKLEVNGSIKATSFIGPVNTYADFVFKPDYKLPALSEVEAHIKERGHLPGIPSEAEARANGMDLGAMQVKLLQQIEELTLHQIAQEKRLNDQSERIERLETENASLRASQSR